MNLEELEKKIDDNKKDIIENSNRIEENLKKIKGNSNAIEVLHTIKSYNNRFFAMWIVTFIALIISLLYNFILLNDTTIITTTTQDIEQETDEGSNYYIGRDGDING